MTNKIRTIEELKPLLAILRAAGKKIVFTNGCFDLIHTGHTRYLAQARSFGDILVVAVNSDASVRSIKDKSRPIRPQDDRAETLAALECIDYITVFEESDPYHVIAELQPDILVKGGDWPVDKIVGKDIVEARGGAVISVPYIKGASTTEIIERIVRKYGLTDEAEKVRKEEGKKGRK